MANHIFQLYRNAFGGLSQPAWILALTMLINRSGSMVLPFLSVYLSVILGFPLREVGLIMSIFGLGSITGAFLGGWLTDKLGYYHVQYLSLVVGGMIFFVVADITDFWPLAIGIYILGLVIESIRPANAASVAHFARPENVTRAFSLNRMAINLGFSIGPAIGGFIAAISYTFLFYVNGVASILAGLLFFFYFKNRKGNVVEKGKNPVDLEGVIDRNPYKDWPYIFFIFLTSVFTIIFFQLIFTLPIYYRQVYLLAEKQIGALIALNGMIIFILEMVVVYKIGSRISMWKLISFGMVMMGFSFSYLNFGHGLIILVTSMIILSISEIFIMPYQATVTIQRAGLYNRGAYMGLFTISHSIGFIIAPLLGTTIIDLYGFDTLWWLVGIASVFTAYGYYHSLRWMK
jgi:MFS family permease